MVEKTIVLANEHIVKTPGVVGGKPRINGTRLAVHHVIVAYVHQGATIEELVDTWETISPAQIYAALAYYYDHQEEIEQLIEAEKQITQAEFGNKKEQILDRWQLKHGYSPRELVAVSEVAEEFGINPRTIREACAKGWISAHKSGSTWLIRWKDAESRWGKQAI